MPTLRFVTLDVFTTTRYQGNPLAVVIVPADQVSTLTQAQKQTIAFEFNYSETIFLPEHGEVDSSNPDSASELVKIDIFTTTEELPFAGHPTIGAGYYLHNLRNGSRAGNVALMTRAGRVPISVPREGWAMLEVPHDTHLHRRGIEIDSVLLKCFPGLGGREAFYRSLGGPQEETAPIFSIVKGMTFLLVRLNGLEDLRNVTLPQGRIPRTYMDAPWDGGFIAVYFYVVLQEPGKGEGNIWKIRTRMVEGSMEDPATGSAACALTSYLAQRAGPEVVGSEGRHRFEIVQGVEMGRRSDIGTEVVVRRGDGESAVGGVEVSSVRLTGTAVKVMEGSLQY